MKINRNKQKQKKEEESELDLNTLFFLALFAKKSVIRVNGQQWVKVEINFPNQQSINQSSCINESWSPGYKIFVDNVPLVYGSLANFT